MNFSRQYEEERMKTIKITYYQSPVGEMILGSIDGHLCMSDWKAERHREMIDRRISRYFGATFEEGTSPIIKQTIKEFKEYFAGKRRAFTVPILFSGTEFQCQVWEALRAIPYGETRSYADIARAIGNPKAVRAVATVNATNPFSIIVPCHRVIGSNRTLTGYGGGLPAKQYLLTLENAENVLFPVNE